ncbi:MAG: CvpA family protein [Acholeplasmatales bacterium]|nr:CvpA family protein [Acholeplasmatales bacterium]
MDFGICGLIDIIIVIGLIIAMIVGYKKGFMKKLISLVGVISIVVFSFINCGQLAQFMIHNKIIYPNIFEHINGNILEYMADNNITSVTADEILAEALNIPGFIAKLLLNGMGNPESGDLVLMTTEYLSTMLMNVISFFIIFISLMIILGILKVIADKLRTNGIVRALDGALGMVLYAGIYAVLICVIFYILSLIIDQEWFLEAKKWLEIDMQLNSEKFRLSKAIYEGNVIKLVFDLLF